MDRDESHFLQSVFEESPIATALFEGEELTIRLANKAMLEIWKKDKTVISQPFKADIYQSYNPNLGQELANVFKTGEAFEANAKRLDITVDDQVQPFYFNIVYGPEIG